MTPRLLGLLLAALALLLTRPCGAQPPPGPEPMADDAELYDVAFRDARQGFAVGDRGVLWSTSDGGRNWRRQPTGTTAALHSVRFADGNLGCLVGGWVRPYAGDSQAVILRTRDSGEHWVASRQSTLPALKEIVLSGTGRGWAVGDSSGLYPAGIFRTEDAGRTWRATPAGEAHRLLTAAFPSDPRGVVAGADGRLQLLLDAALMDSRTPDLGRRPVRRIRMQSRAAGWLVGDGGLLMSTRDGGLSWQRPAAMPQVADFDLRGLSVVGSHIWIAGTPGSMVFHSPDKGQSWRRFPTGQTLPLNALYFQDEQHGWAVGSLGRILHTRDGGRSWTVQREGGRQLAILAVFADRESVPSELIASAAAADGYLTGVEVLFGARQPRAAAGVAETDRVRAAVSAAGGSHGEVGWRFPLPDPQVAREPGSVVQTLDRATDGNGRRTLETHLVRLIRQWRPRVVLTDDPRRSAAAAVVFRALQTAIPAAGEPTAFTTQTTDLGLENWQVDRLLVIDDRARPSAQLSTWRLIPALGQSIQDYAATARGLISDRYQPAPTAIGLREIPLRGGSEPLVLTGDFLRTLKLTPGGGARRRTAASAGGSIQAVQRAAQKRRNVERLLRRAHASDRGWQSQLDDLTRGLSTTGAAQVLLHLAERYRRSGQPESAADVLEQLARRFPESHETAFAQRWLVQYYASGEMTWRLRRRSRRHHLSVRPDKAFAQAKPAASTQTNQPKRLDGPVRVEQQKDPAVGDVSAVRRAKRAAEIAEALQRTRPALYAQPQLRFPLAVAQRAIGSGAAARSFFHAASSSRDPHGWGRCALAELWLPHLKGKPPVPIVSCYEIARPPFLDGRLDDPAWRHLQPVHLTSTGKLADAPATVLLGYDHRYLYLAAACRRTAPPDAAANVEARRRDADLSNRDRLELRLDIDRDYATWYRLCIDDRGWAVDECLGDVTWNPRWAIAVGGNSEYWIIEAALPLEELTSAKDTPGATWALGLQRIVPNGGFQSWTTPDAEGTASAAVRPEAFGLLRFETPQPLPAAQPAAPRDNRRSRGGTQVRPAAVGAKEATPVRPADLRSKKARRGLRNPGRQRTARSLQ